jgi:LPS-assembly protein
LRLYQLDNPIAGFQNSRPGIQANGIRLYSEINFERRADLLGSTWIQSLEPAIQYLNINAPSQNDIPVFDTRPASPSYSGLFRTNRFMGADRIGDANQVTLGITGRLIDPIHGNQVARFSLGQTFYLEDREVHANELIQLGLADPTNFAPEQPLYLLALETQEELEELTRDRSNLIAEAELRLSSEWTFTTDLHLNTSSRNFERGHINFSYLGSDKLSAFNIRYRYASDLTTFSDINGDNFIQTEELFNGNTSQYDVSGVRAVNENWTMVARWQQDIALDRALETMIGARYDTCCWSTGLYWRQWTRRDDDVLVPQTDLKQDSGIFISFELKGLAGVGQGIESLLENGIPGYNRETF